MTRLYLSIVLCMSAPVLAHPGHGKPGFLHSHDAGELAAWLLLVAVVLGLACWKLFRKP
jgi:hypothetical protein